MPSVKKPTTENKHGDGDAIMNSNVKSYANDPYFLKKAEQAKQILKKAGLPSK